MDTGVFARGFVVGLAVAAPVGPIGVLVIRRSLAEGRALGLVTGLGAAAADTVFALLGALGMRAIAGAMEAWSGWLRIAGAMMIAVMALRTMRRRPVASDPADATKNEEPPTRTTLARAFASTFALTLTSPMTIGSFAAVAASIGLGSGSSVTGAVLLALGVLAGSSAWWLALSGGVSLLRHRIDAVWLRRIDVGAGLLLLGFALAALLA